MAAGTEGGRGALVRGANVCQVGPELRTLGWVPDKDSGYGSEGGGPRQLAGC